MLDVIAVTAPIFIIMAIGYAAVRADLLAKAELRALGKFVINFALPALILKALSQRPIAEILNVPYLAVYALGSVTVMLGGVAVAYFIRRRSLPVSALYGTGMAFPNSGFIGYPIVLQVLGPPGLVALTLTMIVENMVLMPLAILLMESRAGSGDKAYRVALAAFARLFRSPIILAIVVGFLLASFDLHPPAPVARVIDMLAAASGAVALFVIGGNLVGLEVKGMFGDVALIMVGKLLLHPLAVFAALQLVPAFDPTLQRAAVMFACSPMMSIYPILGQKYGQEGFCSAALMATTTASFVTISSFLWLIEAGGYFAR